MSTDTDIRSALPQTDQGNGFANSSLPSDAVPYILSTLDAAIILTGSLVGGICYQLSAGNSFPNLLPLCAVGLFAAFIYVLRMSGGRHYEFPECAKPQVEVTKIIFCWLTTTLLLALFAFMLKIGVSFSRGDFIVFNFLVPTGLVGVRKLSKVALLAGIARGAVGRKDVILLGDFYEIAALAPAEMLAIVGGANVTSFTFSRAEDPLRTTADKRTLNLVANFVRDNNCREILLALPWGDAGRLETVRDTIKTLPVSALLLPDMRVRSLSSLGVSSRTRELAIEIQRAPLSAAERLIKRTMDIILAAMALFFFAPILLLTSLAIKLDSSGPIIFRQRRKGFNGKHFVMYKFRTMLVQEDGTVVAQATRNDARVTAIGRLLRSSSIDELPQLLNVLFGNMSLIGPRPHALAHDDYFGDVVADYAFRHHVKPGITGWAQCNGSRGATPSVEDICERVKLDLWYVNNWSLWLDIQIIYKTALVVLTKRNAY